MVVQIFGSVVTLALGVLAGYGLSSKVSPPKSVWAMLLWGLAVVIAERIGVDTRLISIFGFVIYVNQFLMSLILGALLGLIIRNRQ